MNHNRSFKWLVTLALLAVLLVACGGSSEQGADPASVVKAFHEAGNAGNVDAAMALLADDAVLVRGGDVITGNEQIRAWLQSEADRGITFESSNFQVAGDKVTYTCKAFENGRQIGEGIGEAIVQAGKIKYDE